MKSFILNNEKKIIDHVSKFLCAYIYGTGLVGKAVLQLLLKNNVTVRGFVVSKTAEESDEELDGFKIISVNDLFLKDDETVIVAVHDDKARDEIEGLLLRKGVLRKNIYNEEINAWIDNKSSGDYFERFEELDQIGIKCDTDKSRIYHDYLRKYEFFLGKFKESAFTLLELGVYHGSSIAMWADYFSNAEIYGVDIDKNCKQYEKKHQNIIIADLSDMNVLVNLKKLKPTIVVDDASHFWSHQNKGISVLFDCLPSGGIYIVEDLETSFGEYRNNKIFADDEISGYEMLRAISDRVCGSGIGDFDCKYSDEIKRIADMTDMISFIPGSCVLIKK